MRSTYIRLIVLFTLISLGFLLFILWLVDFSQFGIPKKVPIAQIETYGVLILTFFILLFIFLQKRLLKLNPATSIPQMVIYCTITELISLSLFEGIKQFIILKESTANSSPVLLSIALVTVLSGIIATSIALELKKIKGVWVHVPTVLLVVLFILTRNNLPYLIW
jgi:hypothetical protein